MKAFIALFEALDTTNATSEKLAAIAEYFRAAPPADAAWGLYLLSGMRPKRLLALRKLAGWAMEHTGIPEWLFEECYASTGDLAETIALLVPPAEAPAMPSLSILAEQIHALGDADEAAQRAWVLDLWAKSSTRGIFVATKMMTGAMRVGISQLLVTRALATALGLDPVALTDRLMGPWQPSERLFETLSGPVEVDHGRPYPFALASPLTEPVESLGPREAWMAEWKWDGIRCQLIARDDKIWLWSRGEDLVTERFPEIVEAAKKLPPGTVLDGEVLAWDAAAGIPMPFAALQTRIGRKNLSPKVLAAAPVVLVVYDCLEDRAEDLRALGMRARRDRLESLVSALGDPRIIASPLVTDPTWAALATVRKESRARGVEGLMLKRVDTPYKSGRTRGGFWKWKIDPYTIDAVLVYAQPGSGKRSNLLTDYTFALWSGEELVTIAKAYSGLDDAEIAELDKWLRSHTLEKFGPVRKVEPFQVFELAFEGIQRSTRHKSGVAVRFPRMARWRKDKKAADADRIDTLRAMIDDKSGA